MFVPLRSGSVVDGVRDRFVVLCSPPPVCRASRAVVALGNHPLWCPSIFVMSSVES